MLVVAPCLDEALLGLVQPRIDDRRDSYDYSSCNDAIISVSDAYRTSVRRRVRTLLRKKEENGVIVALRWGLALGQSPYYPYR